MSAQGRQVHTTHFISSVHFVKIAIIYVKIADTKCKKLPTKYVKLGILYLKIPDTVYEENILKHNKKQEIITFPVFYGGG